MKNKISIISSLIIVATLVASGLLIGNIVRTANAATTDDVLGYAWSDNIGWISFNSIDGGGPVSYGVGLDSVTGDFSGYAWSDNIGWIDFAPTVGYPEAPNHGAHLEADGSITGWARVLSNGGGWDGWIKLSGVATNGSPYGVSLDAGTGIISGFAWGSDVVGWVSFDASLNLASASSVTLTASPNSIVLGNSSTLTWTSNNMTSCTADWLGAVAVSGTDTVTPAVATTYTINCIGTFGNDTSSATITISGGVIQAINDTANVNENSFVNIGVLANDTVGGGVTITNITAPSHGTVVNNDPIIRYNNTSYDTTDSFTYTIDDGLGNTDTATVNITIYDCGDGTVQGSESCDLGAGNGVCPATCSVTCTINPGCPVCGNGICEAPETIATCPADCVASVCGNGVCESDESFFTCPADCHATIEEF